MTTNKETKIQAAEANAKIAVAAINQIKHGEMKEFTHGELEKQLKKHKAPYVGAVIPILVKEKLIKKEGKTYTFTNVEPIHFALFTEALHRASIVACKKKTAVTVIVSEEEQIETAAAFLKSKGFRLLKPHIEYTEY